MIVHLDADAFFASVEQAADPRLRGRPVAVGGAKRGVVASASYEARKLGIHTTMPTARARKICPHLVLLPGDFDKYERFSRLMFSYAYDHTPVVEVASIDEGYFDLAGNRKRPALEIARTIRHAIAQTLKIPVSEGVASNKLVAAIASKLKKPSAFEEVPPGYEREFLDPLDNRWLPGVGPRLAGILNQAGLARIGQIARIEPRQLALFTGNQARSLWEFARGIDERPVIPDPPAAKSYSEQETFESDITDEDWVLAKLRSLADRLLAKIRADRKTVRTVEVRLRYNDFDECRRSESLHEPTDLEHDLYPVLHRLMSRAWERRVSLRLVSVKLSGIYDGIFQAGLPLLDAGPDPAQRRRLSVVIDGLRARHGADACMRGHDLFLQTYAAAKASAPRTPQILTPSPKPTEWVPLNFKSGYSFLDSLLKPQDIVRLAAERGHRAVAITDPNLHGAVEFFLAAKAAGIRAIIGATLNVDGSPLCAYVQTTTGYQNLCALLSLPPQIPRDAFADRREGLIVRPAAHQPAIRYAHPRDRAMYRVLASIRTLTLLDERSPDKPTTPFHYPATPAAFDARDSLALADACEFAFELGGLRFPRFHSPDGSSPPAFLRRLALEGARRRYGIPSPRVLAQIDEELGIIAQVGYEEYFLLTWDLLWNDCHPQGIGWITRGSAADSLVCYCLGISDVCPIRFDLYFRRFLNPDRMALHKLPDIDIDFAHDRKDDVIDLVFKKFGAHAAVVGGFNTFQGRSAFADIAKVMGVSEFQIRRMTEHMPWAGARDLEKSVTDSQECRDATWEEDPYRTALRLARHLDGMPRHPKMHPCGMVLSREPITALTPLFTAHKGYPTAHFDMDSVEAIGLVKMDLLAQGGLAVMRDTLALLAGRGLAVDLKALGPWDDPAIWEMIASGGARGVHHIESPAMLTLSKMVGAHNIDDLIAIVSVIRPGAANNLKKEQFARRAQGLEPVDCTHPSLEPVLRSTYGVVAYEEHILQICEAFAGLPAGRADILRRALVKCREETIIEIGREFVANAKARGRTREEIKAVWTLVAGFQGYAFCRAHSTAYGVEAYEAAHLKRYHPVEFLACVLTHGKGFYNKLVYSIECRRLGIGLLSPDVNVSARDAFRPEDGSIRVPLGQLHGLTRRTLDHWEDEKPFASLRDFVLTCHPSADEMNALIRVGAFDRFGESRTSQFWHYRELAQWRGMSARLPVLQGAVPDAPGMPARRPAPDHAARRQHRRHPLPETQVRGDAHPPAIGDAHSNPSREVRGDAHPPAIEDAHSNPSREVRGDAHPPAIGDAHPPAIEFVPAESVSRPLYLPQELPLLAVAEQPPDPPAVPLSEPSRLERLRAEQELLGFTASGHPLDLYPDVAWDTYCPIARLAQFPDTTVTAAGLIIETRIHRQADGRNMKFLSICDPTGILECELFADAYRRFAVETVRHAVVEVTGIVTPFESGKGFTLHVQRLGKARFRPL